MPAFRSPCTSSHSDQCLSVQWIYYLVSTYSDSVSGLQRPWSACADSRLIQAFALIFLLRITSCPAYLSILTCYMLFWIESQQLGMAIAMNKCIHSICFVSCYVLLSWGGDDGWGSLFRCAFDTTPPLIPTHICFRALIILTVYIFIVLALRIGPKPTRASFLDTSIWMTHYLWTRE